MLRVKTKVHFSELVVAKSSADYLSLFSDHRNEGDCGEVPHFYDFSFLGSL